MSDIKVNKEQWDAISQTERDGITEGLREAGALKIGDRIVGDPSVAPFDENTPMEPMWNPLKGICRALCDAAAGVGVAFCTAKTAGLAFPVCLAAAEAARRECRRLCK